MTKENFFFSQEIKNVNQPILDFRSGVKKSYAMSYLLDQTFEQGGESFLIMFFLEKVNIFQCAFFSAFLKTH